MEIHGKSMGNYGKSWDIYGTLWENDRQMLKIVETLFYIIKCDEDSAEKYGCVCWSFGFEFNLSGLSS